MCARNFLLVAALLATLTVMSRGGYQHARQAGAGRGGGRDVPALGDSAHSGHLVCGHDLGTATCAWRGHSETALILHRADRHLILPPGGAQALESIDPMLEEERKERMRRARKRGPDEAAEEQQR